MIISEGARKGLSVINNTPDATDSTSFGEMQLTITNLAD